MTYVDQVLSWMPQVFKPQKKAFIALLGALMCFTRRAMIRNLSRYGAGLGQNQVLDSKGQEHFANSSLAALNILRLEDRAWALSKGICLRHRVGSVGSLKLRKYNQLLLNRFIVALGDQLNPEKVRQAYEQSYQTGLLAA